MRKQILLVVFIMISATILQAQTNISGTISNNTTLTQASSPYIVTGNLNVNAGVTLTVESGVEVRFNSGVYLQVFGTLNANSATFTANEGDTPGSWEGIYVSYHNSADVGTVNLDNCIVQYAESIYVRNGELNVSNSSLITNFSSYGLDVYTKGTANLEQTTIENCTYPVYFRNDQGNGHWTVGDGVSLTGNSTDYVFIDFRDIRDLFQLPDPGIPYYYNSELRVLENGTLMLDAGVTMLGNTNAYINVYGKLKANGTSSDSVIFTNEPSTAYWAGLNFQDAAVDSACYFTYSRISGANYQYSNGYRPYEIAYTAMEIMNSSPSFDNCRFTDNRFNLVITGRSLPTFTNCTFDASNYVAKETPNINIDLNAEPEFNTCDISFNDSEAWAIGIIPNTVFTDSHLNHSSFTGLDSITYTLHGQVTIHDTASLGIDPGIVIKCTDNDDYIYANGALTAIGTESAPIVFTHINDDAYGRPADTHTDGTTSPSSSTSGRVILNSLGTSTLDHWIFRYAGRGSSYYAAYAYNGNIIQNSHFIYSHRGVLFSGDAQLTNNTFENIANYPVARRMNPGSPVLIGNQVINSGHLGIYVHDFLEGSYTVGGLDIGGQTNAAYIIDGNIDIPTTADVTIAPGTVFKFSGYYGKLSVRGGLQALGTENNRIIFTSIYDNSASGNTNYNTGDDPTGHKWSGLEFYGSSDDNNLLNNCEIRYIHTRLTITNCAVELDSILLNFSDTHALGIYGSANPVITNSTFNNLDDAPIHMDMFANPTFSNNSVANVRRMAIGINGGTISGTVPIRSFAGHDTITYLIFETMRVDDELTIPAGLTFKGNGSAYWDIYGTLNVNGDPDRPVVFTALQDDNYGNPGDTELNGQASIDNDGNRLVFRDISSDNSMVNNAIFRHSYTYSIYTASVSPTIKNTTFYRSNTSGLYLVGSAAPTVDSCVFDNLQYPIITSLMTYPGSHQGNQITGTTARGIFIIDNETLTQNYTLTKQSFAGIENIPYIFDRYNVGTSAVLTIDPGVILKFIDNGYLNVRNGLIANGGSTPDSAIVFTSSRDDFYGGDTYANGDANQPDRRSWRGIYFFEESIDASCILNNCIFKHATYRYSNSTHSYNRGAVTMNNASPTITNCLFDNDYWGILVRNTSLPVISNCDFVDMNPDYGYGVWNETGTVTVVAEDCWWNDASGPYNATLNPDGEGERVTDNVDFDPWISQTAKPIMGDVSLNGEVMPYDASLVLQHTVGNITLDAKQEAVSDVSGNGSVSSFDASLILQFAIGLITNFEGQSEKKEARSFNNQVVTAPEQINATHAVPFNIPLSLQTPATVKSVDMQFMVDPDQLAFVGLDTRALPADVMVASGYDADAGILKVSLASAYDLGLNHQELGLRFVMKEEEPSQSDLELTGLIVNESAVAGPLLTVSLYNDLDATGIEIAPGLNSMEIYGSGERIIAEFMLADPQSQLRVSVYDLSGRMTNQMALDDLTVGGHRITLLTDENRRSGDRKVFLVNIRGETFSVTKKVILR